MMKFRSWADENPGLKVERKRERAEELFFEKLRGGKKKGFNSTPLHLHKEKTVSLSHVRPSLSLHFAANSSLHLAKPRPPP